MATDRREQADNVRGAAAKTAPTLPNLKEQAETAERGLRLEPADRRRLQVALTSLGFDTRGDDGVFGPRSREMIANWQKARNQPSTGFVTKAQQQALLQEAAAALSKDDEQRKAKEGIPPATEPCRRHAAGPPVEINRQAIGEERMNADGMATEASSTLKPEVRLEGGEWDLVPDQWLGDERRTHLASASQSTEPRSV